MYKHNAAVKANVLDISLNGVCLICSELVSKGENALLAFQIKSHMGIQIEQVWSRVIYARMDDDAWVVGLKFNVVLDWLSTPLLAQAAARRDMQPWANFAPAFRSHRLCRRPTEPLFPMDSTSSAQSCSRTRARGNLASATLRRDYSVTSRGGR
jgi:hypothetical protein